MRSKGSAAELERRRRLAIDRLSEGHSPQEVADFLGVHRRTVQKWKARFQSQGDAGLAAKPVLGRQPKLTNRQIQTVLSWITQSPTAFGYSTELWTARRIRDLIIEHFGVHFHSNYINRWLAARHVTPQRPKRRAKQRDEARINRWLADDWPRLEKKGIPSEPISSSSTKPAVS